MLFCIMMEEVQGLFTFYYKSIRQIQLFTLLQKPVAGDVPLLILLINCIEDCSLHFNIENILLTMS